MFMSVKDFQDRMVVLPEFGRKKKSASSGMHQDVEEDQEPEEEEQREDEGTDTEDADEGEEAEGSDEEGGEEEEEDPDKYCNRECYVFNAKLEAPLDDKCCKHCKLYLTLQCPHINEFMDEVEEGDVD
jgi:hypothetical protein